MLLPLLKYFPFPHPTSIKIPPTGIVCMNFSTLGQGLCRVSLKCDAICSYTFKNINTRFQYHKQNYLNNNKK